MRLNEAALRERNQWKSVAEVPNFPFASFSELQAAVADGSYALEVDYMVGQQFAPLVQSRARQLWSISCAMLIPAATAFGSVAAAVIWHHYALLLAVPIVVVAHTLGGVLTAPARGCLMTVNLFLGACLIAFTALGSTPTIAGLLGAFVLPYSLIRAMYSSSADAFRSALLRSEALFLSLYGKGGFRLRRVEGASG